MSIGVPSTLYHQSAGIVFSSSITASSSTSILQIVKEKENRNKMYQFKNATEGEKGLVRDR